MPLDIDELLDEQRRLQILNMRVAGFSHSQIAQAVHLSPNNISQIIAKELAKTRALADQALEDLRSLEVARLDEAVRALWPKAMTGHPRSIEIILKVMERRAKLLGLDAPERQVTLDLTESLSSLTPQELTAEAQRLGLPLPNLDDDNDLPGSLASLPGEGPKPLPSATSLEPPTDQ